ncbi:MAG TPA: hypothetical protein VF407_06085 [Polyangiaceae bacterium]
MKLRPLVLSVALAAAVAPVSAEAQTAEDQAVARTLFDEGMRLSKEGKYDEACPKFEASLRRYSGIGTRGKLAECYEQVGKTASAWALWSEVASFSRKNNEPDREAYATEHAKALEPKLSHITVKVAPEDQTMGVVVKRNGEAIDAATFGISVPVDPGKIHMEASAPGRVIWNQDIVVAPQGSVAVDVPVLAEAPVETKPTEPGPAKEEKTSWQKPVGIGAIGVGAAGVLTGVVFGLVASSKWSDAFSNGCTHDTNVCTSQSAYDQSQSAHTFATLSNVFIIGGAVVAGAGVVLWVTAPKAHAEEAPKAATLGISPVPMQGGGGLAVHGSLF